jgi:hypothetical protein
MMQMNSMSEIIHVAAYSLLCFTVAIASSTSGSSHLRVAYCLLKHVAHVAWKDSSNREESPHS